MPRLLSIKDLFPMDYHKYTGCRYSHAHETTFWFQDGLVSSYNNGPAVVYNSGTKFWYKDGLCHRTGDLPAIEWVDGSREWLQNGLYHRITGPARLMKEGQQIYEVYNNRYGICEYWLNGHEVDKDIFYGTY